MARMLLTVLTALLLAAPASAAPECTQITPGTRTCVNPGHTAIVTTPNPALVNPSPGWAFGWGAPVIGLGGSGFWIGF
jgi:hypothetical protein